MKEFKEILQKHINVSISIEFGCIGTGYQQILIIENGEIKIIGEFLYKIWNEFYFGNNIEIENLVGILGVEAEKYRMGETKTLPSLCFNLERELEVIL